MVNIKCVTGLSNNDKGSTELRIGMLRKDGTFIVSELQRNFVGVQDRVAARYPASTQGAKASMVLGEWQSREITVPDNTPLFFRFNIKSKSMPLGKRIVFCMQASEEHAMVQLTFPVVTNLHSTILELPITGRFRMMTIAEITEMDTGMRDFAPLQQYAIADLESIGEEPMLDHWKWISSLQNMDGSDLLVVHGGGVNEKYHISCKTLLGKQLKKKEKALGKTKRTDTGRKIVFAGKRRKIKLS